jgi:hypothetical protein
MRGRTFASILLLATAFSTRLEASCIDPAELAHSAVGIARYFDDAERATNPALAGISGTAWFVSPTRLVTAEHVSAAMMLSVQDWKPLDLRDGDDSRTIPARVAHVTGRGGEKLAFLELQTAVPDARPADIRSAPLAPDDQVVTLAYPHSRPRVVGGRFVNYGQDGKVAGAALLEMFDGNDRLAVDYGASGAPVYDCGGRIAAVIITVITQKFPGLSGSVRTSTPWGTPNVLSIPIQALEEYSTAR